MSAKRNWRLIARQVDDAQNSAAISRVRRKNNDGISQFEKIKRRLLARKNGEPSDTS